MDNISPLAVALISGGLDSMVAAASMKAAGYRLLALSIDYNQRHQIELAQQQVHAAAEADRASYHPVVFDLVRAQTRTHLD